jgi:hypothetical protein
MNMPEHISDDVSFANAMDIAADRAVPSRLPLLKEIYLSPLPRNRRSEPGATKGATP